MFIQTKHGLFVPPLAYTTYKLRPITAAVRDFIVHTILRRPRPIRLIGWSGQMVCSNKYLTGYIAPHND